MSRPSRVLCPVVRTQWRFSLRFLALRSSGPVQKYIAPSTQTPSSGVTCGRPSGRTLDSQYNSAPANVARAWDHSVGSAFGLLKAVSSVTGSCSAMLLCRSSRLRLHPERVMQPAVVTAYLGDVRNLNWAPSGSLTVASRPYGVSCPASTTDPLSSLTLSTATSTSSTSQ